MKKIGFISFAILFSITSFAQTTKAPAAKPQAKPVPQTAAPTGTYLENALAAAQKDLAEVNALIVVERKKTDAYQMCTMNEYFARQRSAEWFVNHYSEFETLSHKIDTVIAEANAKIESLGNESVSVIPVEKQGVATPEVKVTLGSMIEYFKVYNSRMKACQKDMQSELQRQMEDPRRNELNLAHSQVVAAMEMMTKNLNASLTDTNTHYELAFGQAECGYQIELRVNMDFNGTKQEYKFSLLTVDSQAAKVELSEEAKWSALIAKNEMIAGYPIDALKRLATILKEERGGCKEIPFIAKKAVSGMIFDAYANLLVSGKQWFIENDWEVTLANGSVIYCEDLNGTFITPEGNIIEITDACNIKKAKFDGGSWQGQGEKAVSWNGRAFDVVWASGYYLRFTPTDVNTFHYDNLKGGGTNTFTRVK